MLLLPAMTEMALMHKSNYNSFLLCDGEVECEEDRVNPKITSSFSFFFSRYWGSRQALYFISRKIFEFSTSQTQNFPLVGENTSKHMNINIDQ